MRHSTLLLSVAVTAFTLSACANHTPRNPTSTSSKSATQRDRLAETCNSAAARGQPMPIECPNTSQQNNTLPQFPATIPNLPNLGGGGGLIR